MDEETEPSQSSDKDEEYPKNVIKESCKAEQSQSQSCNNTKEESAKNVIDEPSEAEQPHAAQSQSQNNTKEKENHKNITESSKPENKESHSEDIFKKPMFILPAKPLTKAKINKPETPENTEISLVPTTPVAPPVVEFKTDYKEPAWGGIPSVPYSLEVLKNGSIVGDITIGDKKGWYIVGRQEGCDVILQHPSISRQHAVLQFCTVSSEETECGLYIKDSGSTHGTWVNKLQIKPHRYLRVRPDYVLKFGGSTRLHIVHGPDEDKDNESELSVTELMFQRLKKENERELKIKMAKKKIKEMEEEGVDWGMGEDADEKEDMDINPYAIEEELELDDPKKTLRGWFEREGLELVYDVEEKGYAQFLCRVELPIPTTGQTMVAEAAVTGKKKEAVIQCAIEACKILNRYGLLKQSTHESREKRQKDWEADDFYDSDEDTFLDRTGTIELKRKRRMEIAGKGPEAKTHQELVSEHEELLGHMKKLEEELSSITKKSTDEEEGKDVLDVFMEQLKNKTSKSPLVLKTELSHLRKAESQLKQLVEISRPKSLPELKPITVHSNSTIKGINKPSKQFPMIGKRPGAKKGAFLPVLRPVIVPSKKIPVQENEEESKESEDIYTKEETDNNKDEQTEQTIINMDVCDENTSDKPVLELTKSEIIPEETIKIKKSRPRSKPAKPPLTYKELNEHDGTYETWTPPQNQSGDGRTSLNDKLGY